MTALAALVAAVALFALFVFVRVIMRLLVNRYVATPCGTARQCDVHRAAQPPRNTPPR